VNDFCNVEAVKNYRHSARKGGRLKRLPDECGPTHLQQYDDDDNDGSDDID
jgi:hypothetical protein